MKLIVICGATATGKSDLAIALASELNAEIINADSMQIYKGMDIGTAKLPVSERAGIAHHMLDVLEVNQDSTVAWYQEQARAAISDIHARGKDAIVVGGTGLYIKSILDELNFPDTDPVVRAGLELELATIGLNPLFERLEKLDPAAAIAIDRANSRRVIRALEVIAITGKPFTANLPREASTRYPNAVQFGLVMDRDHLGERISQRVDRMWELGFVEEVEKLIKNGITTGRTAQLALGYSQLIAMQNGLWSEEEAKEDTKRATRQYARRQETWFSRDERITWISQAQPRFETAMHHLEKIN
ncbi:MAG: tRNA (adenosine(37)-N6)-dimethylallyltransferase MiaA [Actinobacteria bacterium]|uniref:tRNA dimethylallyltransferase n=1 Tax=freshwater metagenome TaxID=449393 RepID=A0A6J6ZM56_9ZZZZ|nr:tRNA (adenosine(37)-N6)-dimethylallyltransferase MiaA [Actinomycetota bacterium]MSX71633.1 tRNA (adenosine(37)-N6)-dimethylallyltransferase MiaA [Actinomycetota bacterium]MSY68952.1 tRNA (adenosine(37)-N6)-dimethylallyltransferase MiaA [Actinomycetota bacterium]MTA75766.1 tRNA (adenosine(37)-N6)-dimethylallyltransferase MiaA [Actinomycetota bacterium]